MGDGCLMGESYVRIVGERLGRRRAMKQEAILVAMIGIMIVMLTVGGNCGIGKMMQTIWQSLMH